MKSARVIVALLALSALPLVAAVAQGHSNNSNGNNGRRLGHSDVQCAAEAGNSGKVPPGQAKKCPEPPPPPVPPAPVPPPPGNPPPPTGVNFASGVAFADLAADGRYDPFAGDTVLAGVAVELRWFGAVVQSATTQADGSFRFDGLGNTGTNSWELCVSVPAGLSQGPPVSSMPYNGCGGTGYAFSFNSGTIQAAFMANFGMLVP